MQIAFLGVLCSVSADVTVHVQALLCESSSPLAEMDIQLFFC